MVLGVREIAVLIGRSERQVRNMLQHGIIKGRKRGKVWLARRVDVLQVFPELQDELMAKAEAIRSATEEVLERKVKKAAQRPFRSFRDLRIITTAVACHKALDNLISTTDDDSPFKSLLAIQNNLTEGITFLAVGYHEFHKAKKNEQYLRARETFSAAAAMLHILQIQNRYPDQSSLIDIIERDVIARIGALLKSTEIRS
ncbi:helix-turn-helix domain-containing protein [bacterium]|nr:helix-turn-helix domain-containing protein [candidate division CSSED10-310 bacterium]